MSKLYKKGYSTKKFFVCEKNFFFDIPLFIKIEGYGKANGKNQKQCFRETFFKYNLTLRMFILKSVKQTLGLFYLKHFLSFELL